MDNLWHDILFITGFFKCYHKINFAWEDHFKIYVLKRELKGPSSLFFIVQLIIIMQFIIKKNTYIPL